MQSTHEKQDSHIELEYRRDVSSVLLLREMQKTQDYGLRKQLFEQAADQEFSHISEVLEGKVSTRFDFDVRGGELCFLQPNGVTNWREMHENGYLRAKAIADNDSRFKFYERLSKAELDNATAQEALLQEGRPFAMVELSLSGDDMASPDLLKKVGRDPELKRAFLRVSISDGERFSIYSESVDGMELNAALDIATGWGVWENPKLELGLDASSADILATPIIFGEDELSVGQMHELASELVGAYDKTMTARTGSIHISGRSSEEAVHTYEFVLNNPDLMDAHMGGLRQLAASNFDIDILAEYANNLRYDIMASYKRRLEGSWVDKGSLAESVAGAGSSEREAGTAFYGCDSAIGANANLANGGYANAESKSLMELSGKKIQCANSDCKKKVVVPDSELLAGRLTCSECGLQYDVCTGESKFKKIKSKSEPKVKEESPWAKWNREYETKRQREKLRLVKETDLAKSA